MIQIVLCATNCLVLVTLAPASPKPSQQGAAGWIVGARTAMQGAEHAAMPFWNLAGCRMRYSCDRVSVLSRDAWGR
ncbi:hypothetical protein C2L64_49605 [Paraburkholderia hospita]|uniref:Secreted protein n=1 Tax=Paraburkholderia hospita TaxID=169430 RepID=A0AAN1JNE0_9BURK|nr:hypothetical protein C2L64_49605 [Paraburkholderia hospita]